jgi:uncharacterized membrane protein YedE/YeeE
MRVGINFALGLLFGLGLVISGMANPAKVQNFLDLAGTWDPSLAFVMGGAVAATSVGYFIARRRYTPVLETVFEIPPGTPVDTRLIAGSPFFGLGWDLSGFCPGPAITALSLGATGTIVFVPAMIFGILAGARMSRGGAVPGDG